MDQAFIQDNIFLLHAFLLGIGVTFVYDGIRIFRRVIYHNLFFISLEDFIYWTILIIKVFLLMQKESNGELRWFAIAGAFVGMLLYRKTISPYYVFYVSKFLRMIVKTIIEKPVKFLGKRINKGGKKIQSGFGKMRKMLKNKLTRAKKFIRMILCKQ